MDATQARTPGPTSCARCGRELIPGAGDFFVVRVVAVADAAPALIPEAGLFEEIGDELRRLRAQAGAERPFTDAVYQSKTFPLCLDCFKPWMDDPVGDRR